MRDYLFQTAKQTTALSQLKGRVRAGSVSDGLPAKIPSLTLPARKTNTRQFSCDKALLVGGLLLLAIGGIVGSALAYMRGAFSPASPENPRWRVHHFSEHKFRVLLPHEPFRSNGLGKNCWGQTSYVEINTFLGNRMYTMLVVECSVEIDKMNIEQALDETIADLLPRVELVTSRPITHQGFSGREIVFKGNQAHDYERQQVFLRGRELIRVIATGSLTQVMDAEASAFFDSFQFDR